MHLSTTLFVTITSVLLAFARSNSLINDVESPGKPKGEYIITFKSNNRPSCITHNPNVIYHYTIINGVAGRFTDDEIKELQASPDVEGVYEDHDDMISVNTHSEQDDPANTYSDKDKPVNTGIQRNATWGLARLSSKNKLTYTNITATNFTFYYNPIAGFNVDIYVVDSGVNINHTDFGGRAQWGTTFGAYPDRDDNGHGTMCAGLAAGTTYGVAKLANIIAVKVIGYNITKSRLRDIVYGLEWVQQQTRITDHPSVVNLSIGSKITYWPLDLAVINKFQLVNENIPVVVAAGNEAEDARQYSPAGLPEAITVAASNITDQETWWSNYGPAVDIFAGGENIVSTQTNSTTATTIDSGTSFSTAYVTGLVAILLASGKHPPAELKKSLIKFALHGVLTNVSQQTPNILATNGLLHKPLD
ncbi:hypothetical protein C0995_011780 [Termitomyces sp. Mi166|nr:hypothetical protein C0995_011780 [Termitomyces sp. Mi166\